MKRPDRKIVLTLENETKGKDYLASLARHGISLDQIVTLFAGGDPPEDFGGLVLGGGEDVDPELFGQSRHPNVVDVNRQRDDQELELIDRARRRGVPIFGICRGLQVLNVAFGGTLIQDIAAERPSAVSHRNPPPIPKDYLAHEVRFDGQRCRVNSRHHQGIDRPGDGLLVAARADDGLIEAVEAAEAPLDIFAVQWHPENLGPGAAGQDLFSRFAGRVRAKRE